MKVVLADDSDVIRKIWRAYLRKLGHEVVGEGCDGREAVALCEEHRPDLVMLDVTMGEYGGEAAALAIQRRELAGTILMASSETPLKSHFESLGMQFVAKPLCDVGQLKIKLDSIFGE